MGRKVSVALEADVAGFVRPVETAKRSVDDLGDKVVRLDRELDKIPADASKAGAAMKLLGGNVDDVGAKVMTLGEKNNSLAVLDSKIKSTRSEVRKLADEFVKTGDGDVFKKLGDSQGRLGALTKIRKDLANSVEVGVGEGMLAGFKLPGLQHAMIGIGATLAVPLVAGLGGALAGGVGVGVAGVGILGAVLGDPERFKSAWSRTLNDLEGQFINATRPLTDDTIHALSTIGPTVASWHLNDLFDDAEKHVEPLVHGIEGFATGTIRGVSALVDKGGPAVDALSQGLGRLGIAAGNAMASIADNAEGGALALHDTINTVSTLIEVFGKVTGAAEGLYGFIREHPIGAAIGSGGLTIPVSVWTAFDHTTSKLTTTEYGLRLEAEKVGHAFNAQGDDLTALAQKLNTATLSADTLAGSMVNKLFTGLMNVDQATLGVNRSAITLGETLERNHNQIDKTTGLISKNTTKGIENREAVLAVVQANMAQYQSQLAVGASAEDAAKQYDENTAKLEAQLKQAHLTDAQINDLIGTYRNIPDTVNTTIAVEGLTQAINNLDHTLRLMAGLKDKDVYVRLHNIVYNETTGQRVTGNSRLGGQDDKLHGGIRYRAATGMIVPPSDPGTLLFGEPATGGEAYIPLRGISQSRAMGLAQTVGNNYGFSVSSSGGGGGNITITLSGGDSLTSAMLKSIRAEVRRGFGGNVQVALGANSR